MNLFENGWKSAKKGFGVRCLLAWVGVLLGTWAGSVHAEAPNVVFILADDLGWSDLACYGHAFHQTPNIDRLAGEGMRFTQAYAPAPICSASRAAILTGKTPARLHFEFVTKNQAGSQDLKNVPLQTPPFTLNLPLSETTLGEVLEEAGYATGFFGKWHLNQHHEYYLGWSPTHGPLQQGFRHGSSDFGSHPYAYRSDRDLRDSPTPRNEFAKDSLIDQVTGFIQQHRQERFFLYVSQYFVHDPIHSRSRWLVDEYERQLPTNGLPIRASYGAMIETLDHLVGRVLQALEDSGVAEETLVVFTSDNGGHPNYTTNAPLRGSKWNLYEGGIRVPMIVRWPGHVQPGSQTAQVAHGCDLLPTLCEVAGVRVPDAANLDGQSLVPVLTQRAGHEAEERTFVWHFPYYHPEKRFHDSPKNIGIGDFATSQTRPHSAIRHGDWKLIRFYETERIELYKMQDDVSEQRDRSEQRADMAQELQRRLDEYLERVEARLPSPMLATD